jgi:hypothetical protein
VREHLRILKLPEDAQAKLAAGDVPLRAVKALEGLAAIAPGLATGAITQVLHPNDEYEPYTWADLERDPLGVATLADQLPDGVYRANASHPVDAFTLSEQAQTDLAALENLLGSSLTQIRFAHDDVEQARQLGAAHGEQHQVIIVGNDVADQLAGDYIARCLKVQRANQRRQRQAQAQAQHRAIDARENPVDGDAEQARRAEREARERATAFNGELGELAMGGARYGFPGWVQESTQANGKTKLVYVEQRAEAQRRASEYLAGATTGGELVGRQLALVAMAVYSDQRAVAVSNRSWHGVKGSGPWAAQVGELLDELVSDRLPTPAVALLESVLADHKQQREQELAESRVREAAIARLEGVEQRIAELGAEDLARVREDLEVAWAGWDPRQSELRQLVRGREEALAAQASDWR